MFLTNMMLKWEKIQHFCLIQLQRNFCATFSILLMHPNPLKSAELTILQTKHKRSAMNYCAANMIFDRIAPTANQPIILCVRLLRNA